MAEDILKCEKCCDTGSTKNETPNLPNIPCDCDCEPNRRTRKKQNLSLIVIIFLITVASGTIGYFAPRWILYLLTFTYVAGYILERIKHGPSDIAPWIVHGLLYFGPMWFMYLV